MKCSLLSFQLKAADTFRKIGVIERSGNFVFHASIQTQGAHAPRYLCLREACPALLWYGDLIRLWVGLIALKAMKTSNCCSYLSSAAGGCRHCCCSTACCIRLLVKSREASVCYKRQFGIILLHDLVDDVTLLWRISALIH